MGDNGMLLWEIESEWFLKILCTFSISPKILFSTSSAVMALLSLDFPLGSPIRAVAPPSFFFYEKKGKQNNLIYGFVISKKRLLDMCDKAKYSKSWL